MRWKRGETETPSSHLWVGNLPIEVAESELAELFDKHGVIDGITCYASRSYAFIYYKRVEDAVSAKDSLQGFILNGNPLKIEFAKPAKPSKHVWVGGFSSSVSKEMLEEELSKFGAIEDLKFIRDRNTALVDFASLEDAAAAVKNMNGLQIGDDRIRVDYLRSHPARREQSDFHEIGSAHFRGAGGFDPTWVNPDMMRSYPEANYSGNKRPQPSQSIGGRKSGNPSKVLWVGYPPSVVIDEEMLHNAMILHGEIERIKSFPGRHYSFVEFRSVEEAKKAKDALQGRLFNDPRISIMFSNSDLAPGKDVGPQFPGPRGQRPDTFGNEGSFRPPLMDMLPSNRPPNGLSRPPGGLNQRKLSPSAAGLLPSPSLPGRTAYKTTGWDVLDPNNLPREPKRSRIDGPSSFHDPPVSRGDGYIGADDQPYGAGHLMGGPFARLSPKEMGGARGHPHGRGSEDYIWRGVIAKGGTPVCHARCIPMGEGLDWELPEVVNCSARTGLDMLAKHYAGSIGFDIVFFLPDSEDDFANYTEFLRYLGSKDRAGVAKLNDGTTMFLVPPSDFLTDVLQITGRERLYGVVLKLPQQLPGAHVSQQFQQSLPPFQQMDRHLAPATLEYVPKQDLVVQLECGTPAPGESALPPKVSYPGVPVTHAQTHNGIPLTSRPAVSLTPELIASLQSIIPGNQTAVTQSAQQQVSSSTTGLTLPPSLNEKGAYSQGWSQPPQVFDQTGVLSQQFGGQMYPQFMNTFQSFPSNLNASNHPIPVPPEKMTMQNPAYNMQEQGFVPSRPPAPNPVPVQGQQFVPPNQVAQPYPTEFSHSAQNSYGILHGGTTASYSVAESQQSNNQGAYSNTIHEVNQSRPEMIFPSSTGLVKAESVNMAPSGDVQSSAGGVGAKNQQYESTLQLAASLLRQIHQKQVQQQQQASSHNQQ